MIEITEREYIDNLNGIILKWDDVESLTMRSSFIEFYLKADNSFYKNLKNPIKRWFYRIDSRGKNTFHTNIRFAEGKNDDIYKKINMQFKKM